MKCKQQQIFFINLEDCAWIVNSQRLQKSDKKQMCAEMTVLKDHTGTQMTTNS